MENNPLPRLDEESPLRSSLLSHCRLKPGEIWTDPINGHKVGCLDATNRAQIQEIMGDETSKLAIHDPPYNLAAFEIRTVDSYISWCKEWMKITNDCLDENSALYIWIGANQKEDYQPLPEFIIMMRSFNEISSRSFITMRNQRGYGTQQNWMAVRQECLYYTKGTPLFDVQYTEIPKILRGYYKDVGGKKTENIERSKSNNIRASNVWVDVQQVFYRMSENVNGCYAQKPLKSIERLVLASSNPGDLVVDFFGHSGTTLIVAEQTERRCFIADIDPIYCEIMIRRLERYRENGDTGWQNSNPFVKELNG